MTNIIISVQQQNKKTNELVEMRKNNNDFELFVLCYEISAQYNLHVNNSGLFSFT